MADIKVQQPGVQQNQQTKGTTGPKSTSRAGGFDKLNLNQLGPAGNNEGVRTGRQIGLPSPDTTDGSAADVAQDMRSLVTVGDDGKPVFDLTPGGLASFATASSQQYSEIESFSPEANLASIGESITPEKRDQLRKLSDEFQSRLAALSDEDRQQAFSKLAGEMSATMQDTFKKNGVAPSAEGMERFFKFDPAVPKDENFLAQLGGFISAMRGEEPNGSFAANVTWKLDKIISLQTDVKAGLNTSEGVAKNQFNKTFRPTPPTGGGSGPGSTSGGQF